jgi:hypothetical protein
MNNKRSKNPTNASNQRLRKRNLTNNLQRRQVQTWHQSSSNLNSLNSKALFTPCLKTPKTFSLLTTTRSLKRAPSHSLRNKPLNLATHEMKKNRKIKKSQKNQNCPKSRKSPKIKRTKKNQRMMNQANQIVLSLQTDLQNLEVGLTSRIMMIKGRISQSAPIETNRSKNK